MIQLNKKGQTNRQRQYPYLEYYGQGVKVKLALLKNQQHSSYIKTHIPDC